MNADAYFKARQQYAPSNSMDSSFFEQLLLFRLPTIASQLLPQSDENLIRDVFLFNENYVVKPPQSHVEFRWHRDEDEQLAMCLNREQIKPYISAWCALDKVTKLNGALRFVPLHSSASYGKESKDIESDEPDEQTQRLEEQATLPLEVDAGTVIFFLSNVWHCSSANDSTSSLRRAFYTQYSSHVITSSYNDPTPLSFGVRCHLFDDSDRGLIANRKEESIKTKKKQRVSKCLKR
jgi:ectoine hydroxylase-related dioxygenase (phytanoyl-CoA dioxygenase family)